MSDRPDIEMLTHIRNLDRQFTENHIARPQVAQSSAAADPGLVSDDELIQLKRLQAQALLQQRELQGIDPKTLDKRGAPAVVRAAVGNARTPEDRLSTLRRYYPDAEPYEDDNFVFTDPQTKRKTIYNPKGLDFGDIPSIGPEIAEMIGGAAGGAAAVPIAAAAGIPTGGASVLTIPAGVGIGAAGARELYDTATKALIGTDDTRGPLSRMADTVVTGGVNAIGQRAGDLVQRGARALIGMVPRNAPAGPSALTDFANVGVTPSAGAATENRAMQMIEKGVSNTPGGARQMQQQAEQQVDELRTAAEGIANRMGPGGTTQETGETIRQGARNAGDRFAQTREMLDDRVANLIGRDTPVPVPNVQTTIAEMEAAIAAAPATRRPQLQAALDELRAVATDASQGGIPFQALREARTALGRELERPDVSGFTPRSEAALRRAYAVLSDDIFAAARNAGPDAERALATHDRYVRFNRNINLPLLQKIADKGTDEEAFKYALSGAKDGGSRLLALRRNLSPEEWDVVSSSVFSKLGRAKAGQQGATELGQEGGDFSINTFMTNWNSLSPEARRALFAGSRYAGLHPEIASLTRVADRLKEAEKMGNYSGTARNLLVGAGVLEAGHVAFGDQDPSRAAMGLAGAVVAPHLAARLITSPRFINWLTGAANATARRPDELGPRLGRLLAIAKAEPELREAIYGYLDALRAAPAPQGSETSPAAAPPTQ